MELEVIDIKNVDFTKFQISKSGRKVRFLYDKMPVKFQTSTLYSPFGVKSTNKDWKDFTEYSVDCSLNQSSAESSKSFQEFLEKLDETFQVLVQENLNIFGTPKVSAPTEVEYNNILRVNGTYPKLMRLQLPRDTNGNFKSFVFDENRKSIQLKEDTIEVHLSKGKVFKCIIECNKVWYYNGKVGTIWDVNQLKFSKNEPRVVVAPPLYGSLMIDD
jgi:hypothetical protein